MLTTETIASATSSGLPNALAGSREKSLRNLPTVGAYTSSGMITCSEV